MGEQDPGQQPEVACSNSIGAGNLTPLPWFGEGSFSQFPNTSTWSC